MVRLGFFIVGAVVPLVSILLVISIFASSAQAAAETGLFSEGLPVEVAADYLAYDKGSGVYRARGSVVITQGATTVMADEAVFDTVSGKASAYGGVVMRDGSGREVAAESMEMDLKAGTAVAARGRLFYPKQTATVTGDVVRKTGEESYEFEGAGFTTCDCPEGETPSWSFRAAAADVKTGDSITARGAYFYVKDVPVLYSPYLSVPLSRGRQSGFLMPKPRYSELRGFALENSWYWAISRSTDATFYLDTETRRGVGEGVEYRYIRALGSEGEFFVYHFKERDIERVRSFRAKTDNMSRPRSAGDDRLELRLRHEERLPGAVVFRADVNAVSDDEYFIDFGRGASRNFEALESSLSVTKDWAGASLTANFRVFDNLMKADDSALFRKLPEVVFTVPSARLLSGPFYFSMDSTFVNFSRDAGYDGLRLDVAPRLSLPMSPGGWTDLTLSAGPRATIYAASGNAPGGAFSDRYLYDVKADLATSFFRLYRGDSGGVYRHVVRPSLGYEFVPAAGQADLPSFDSIDRVAARSAVTYALYSSLSRWDEGGERGAAAPSYSDYFRFEARQSYDFKEASRALVSPTDERRPLSDLTLEFDANPSQAVMVSAKGRYSVYDNRFTNNDVAFRLKDSRGDTFSAAYRFTSGAARYAEGGALVRLTDSVAVSYLNRYSFDRGKSLETAYGLDYASACWGVNLSYSAKLEERVIMAAFTLRGLGKVAGIETTLSGR